MVWEPEKVYEDLKLCEVSFEKLICPNLTIKTSILIKVNLAGAKLEKLRLEETKFKECNLANLETGDSNWWEIEMYDSKLTGMRLVKPIWENISIINSRAQYLQLRFGKIKKTKFNKCDLRWSDFQETDFSGCEFRDCDLSEADFSGTKLKGTDLRGSNLTGLKMGINEIKGAMVTTSQALYLSGLLGIQVRD